MRTKTITPIETYEEIFGEKLKGIELDEEIKRTFNLLWKYDNNLMIGELITYISKYHKTTKKRVWGLVIKNNLVSKSIIEEFYYA